MTKTIEILISPDGELTIEAKGYVGVDCEKATAALEEALCDDGSKKRDLKPERYQRNVNAQKARA